MEKTWIAERAEQIVRDAQRRMLTVVAGECLCCFVNRQLQVFGCNNTHRFALSFRDQTAPRATALARRLDSMGACCCDCEILLNAYWPARALWHPAQEEVLASGVTIVHVEAGPPEQMPPCRGVRRGSTQPCGNWERRRRHWGRC